MSAPAVFENENCLNASCAGIFQPELIVLGWVLPLVGEKMEHNKQVHFVHLELRVTDIDDDDLGNI